MVPEHGRTLFRRHRYWHRPDSVEGIGALFEHGQHDAGGLYKTSVAYFSSLARSDPHVSSLWMRAGLDATLPNGVQVRQLNISKEIHELKHTGT